MCHQDTGCNCQLRWARPGDFPREPIILSWSVMMTAEMQMAGCTRYTSKSTFACHKRRLCLSCAWSWVRAAIIMLRHVGGCIHSALARHLDIVNLNGNRYIAHMRPQIVQLGHAEISRGGSQALVHGVVGARWKQLRLERWLARVCHRPGATVSVLKRATIATCAVTKDSVLQSLKWQQATQ